MPFEIVTKAAWERYTGVYNDRAVPELCFRRNSKLNNRFGLSFNHTAMKIIIAPQGFKGGISGLEAAQAIARGVLAAVPDAETVLLPVADGGDGTLHAARSKSRAASSAPPHKSTGF